MNKENIKKLIKRLEKVRDLQENNKFCHTRFSMASFRRVPEKFNKHYGKCQTIACIAGHACIMAKYKSSNYEAGAKKILGINEDQALALFYGTEIGAGGIDLGKITISMAIATLKELLLTGYVNWYAYLGEDREQS